MAFKFRARMAPAGSANGRFRRSFANSQFHTAILCDFDPFSRQLRATKQSFPESGGMSAFTPKRSIDAVGTSWLNL
jgi:hypothetical protein